MRCWIKVTPWTSLRKRSMKSDTKDEKIKKLKNELLKTKWSMFYMRYVKILIMALFEIIAEMYGDKKK